MGKTTITLTKTSGKKVKFCQFTQEMVKIIDIRDTEVDIEIDDSITEATKSDLDTVFTNVLSNHVPVFESTVLVTMVELYGLMEESEIIAIGTSVALKALLQSINRTLNETEWTSNFAKKFCNICQMNNFTTSGAQDIYAVDKSNKKFTVEGDFVSTYSLCPQFLVQNSTGNDGWYTNGGVSLDSGNTVITVVETISDSTVDGTIRDPIMSNKTRTAFYNLLTERGLDMS